MATKSLSARAAALIVISCLSATALIAQTAIKLPKNRYTPEQDVQIGREAAAEIRQQYPIIRDERITRYLTRLGDRLVAAAPPELNKPVYQVLVHAGEPEGDQRVRAPGRADVRAAGHVHRGRDGRRGGWRDGPRAVPRPAAPRNGECVEGAESVAAARATGRATGRCRGRRGRGSGHRPERGFRAWHPAPPIQPRFREAGRPARRADHGPRGLRPSGAGSDVRDDCEGVEEQRWRRASVDEQPSGSRQPHALHHPGSRSADHCQCCRRSRLLDHQDGVCRVAGAADDGRTCQAEDRAGRQHRSIRRHSRPAGAPPGSGIPEHQRRQGLPGRRARRTGLPCRPATPSGSSRRTATAS